MNRFAELRYGRVVYIFETTLPYDKLSTIFDPSTYWVDVTGIECEVGYLVSFQEGVGLIFTKPPNHEQTLEEAKSSKIAEMKLIRDTREVAPVLYEGIYYDYDSKSRDRLDSAYRGIIKGEREYEDWVTALNDVEQLTKETYEGIDKAARDRSRELHKQYLKLKIYIASLTSLDSVKEVSFDTETNINLEENIFE